MVTQIYEIQSEIWGPLPPEVWRSKNMQFWCDFAQVCNFIAIISVTQQDIVSRKTALQTTDTPTQANLIQYFYLGPQMAKNRTGVLTHPPAIIQKTGVKKSVAFARWCNGRPLGWAVPRILVSYAVCDHGGSYHQYHQGVGGRFAISN